MSDLPTETQDDPTEFYRFLAKIVIQLVNSALKDSPQREWYFKFPHDLGEFAHAALEKKYPWSYVKKIVDLHVDLNQYWPCITYAELVSLYPCEVLSDDGALSEICDKVLTLNPKSVADYKKGKTASLNHLKGAVMRETKGKADVQKVESILKEKLI